MRCVGGAEARVFIASSRTERTTSSLRSVMSLVTPDDEKAGGIVSYVSHAPFANAKKSVHAFTFLSTYEGSNTFSAGRAAGPAGVCAIKGIAAENVSAVRRRGDLRIELNFR